MAGAQKARQVGDTGGYGDYLVISCRNAVIESCASV